MSRLVPIRIEEACCRGCRRCEAACAGHDRPPFNPRRAGIRVIKDEQQGRDHPVLNMECLEQFCGKQEPEAADRLEPACVTACLFGALRMEKEVDYGE
ncbi:MAG: hypothetical protein V5A14_00795 [Desulfohalobiaceae bacterium]